MAYTGTYVIADLDQNRNATVAEIGEDRVNEIVQAELAAHNALVNDMVQTLALVTDVAQLRSGAGDSGNFEEIDELGRERTQKVGGGQTVGFPLRRFGRGTGWDREYLSMATLAEIQNVTLKIEEADRRNVAQQVKTALFSPTNYTFFDEYGRPQIEVPVKGLYNADGSQIGQGPNGETFNGATHTHYLANVGLTAALVNNAVATVVEHGYETGVEIYISRTNRDTFAGLAGFTAALGPKIVAGANITVARGNTDASYDNSYIGVWNGTHDVYTKPWIPAGYFAVVAAGQNEESRPLAFRQHWMAGKRGLYLDAEIDIYPMRARYMRRFFGMAVYNRAAASVADFVNATYTAPVFTA